MRLNLEDDSAIKRYLLGELTEEDQQKLEERLLTDNEYFERLELVEDELVDEYASGALTPGEQEKFKSYFLSTPERRQKIEFASALRRYVSARQPERLSTNDQEMSAWQTLSAALRGRSPILGYSLAAALLTIALGGPWSMIRTARLQNQIEQLKVQQNTSEKEWQRQFEDQRVRSGQLAEELARARSQRLQPSTLALVLTPRLVRGGESTNKVTVTPDVSLIRLELQIPGDDYKAYRAAIHNEDGAEILIQNMLRAGSTAGNPVVIVSVPADTVVRGDYYAKLSGIKSDGDTEELGKYYFRIVKN